MLSRYVLCMVLSWSLGLLPMDLFVYESGFLERWPGLYAVAKAKKRRSTNLKRVRTVYPGFAVVELFTSEGCSSCPPADRFVNTLVAHARRKNLRIFPLVYHVDYWNHLGWKDRFSQRIFTYLQQLYVRAQGGSTLYTPQMIVDGRWSFIGSRRRDGWKTIRRALRSPSRASIRVKWGATKKGRRTVLYRVKGNLQGVRIELALVERGLYSRVQRGENRGRLLRSDNVVRVYRSYTIPKNKRGQLLLQIPKSIKKRSASVILLLRKIRGRHILGVAQMALQ